MTNDKITPEHFVKEWLPEERYKHMAEVLHQKRVHRYRECFDYDSAQAGDWEIKKTENAMFHEALDAFAKSICERQREICANTVIDAEIISMGYCEPQTTARAVLNAPMPDLTKNR